MIKICVACEKKIDVKFSRFRVIQKIYVNWYMGKHIEEHSYEDFFKDGVSPL